MNPDVISLCGLVVFFVLAQNELKNVPKSTFFPVKLVIY